MTERQAVTGGLFALTLVMLGMAWANPALWDVKLFEVIMQAVVLTGLLNMVAAFHFAANKQNELATQNTGKMADAITAAANAGTTQPSDAIREGDTVVVNKDPET